ncbi:neugrin [Chanos chanos]|uniref:Neugrin n=1 Tax=Chanos chanos TaxID=29144 RepID=A0A6J2W925_CHACN|nr:neugrin [Chanos chanos]
MSFRAAYFVMIKLGSPHVVPGWVCRSMSRNARMWTGQNQKPTNTDHKHRQQMDSEWTSDGFEMDPDFEDVEEKLEIVIQEERRKQKASKFHRIKRQMSDPGPPERELTWDAIEQIRYLKQESPEEWTVKKLAEGFSVSPDVIHRVLRSKFTPARERKLRQDAKVLATIRQSSLTGGKADQSTKLLPKSAKSILIPSSGKGSIMPLTSSNLVVKENETGLLPSSDRLTAVAGVASQVSTVQAPGQISPPKNLNEKQHSAGATEEAVPEEEHEEDENWDGEVLTEEELENLMRTLPNKLGPVEQRGREFFDSDGNFLYRV